MNPLIKHWQFTLFGIALLLSLAIIGMALMQQDGIKLGMDFKGGTLYQIELQEKVTVDEITRIARIISQRVDPSGLKDTIVSPVGGQFIVVQLSETNASELEKIESRIRQQGKFEATLNGETLFTGDQILKVLRTDQQNYGVFKSGAGFEWRLPFVLNEAAVNSFAQKTFHRCTVTSTNTNGTPVYDCDKTYFFLDKPHALVVMTSEEYDADTTALLAGDMVNNYPQGTDIEALIKDSNIPVVVLDTNNALPATLPTLENSTTVLVSPEVPASVQAELSSRGYTVTVVAKKTTVPWIWSTLSAKQVISLTENVTNEDVADVAQAKKISTLIISGHRDTIDTARKDLEELAILLESGSLPTPVKSISKETISPSLSESFRSNIVLMGIIALIMITLMVFIRYHNPLLSLPMIFESVAELIMMIAILIVLKVPLDLAAFAGLIASLGTGIDSQIVMADEMLRKDKEINESLIKRAKDAFFIITTSVLTVVAVMGPIAFGATYFPGISKLYGFAVTTMIGAFIGIMIARPAFAKLLEMIVAHKEKKEGSN